MSEKKEYADFEQVKPAVFKILELHQKLNEAENKVEVNSLDSITKYFQQLSTGELPLQEEKELLYFMTSLDLSELLSIQTIMYIGRSIIDGSFEENDTMLRTPNDIIKYEATDICNCSFEKEVLSYGMIEKSQLTQYLSEGMRYLDSF